MRLAPVLSEVENAGSTSLRQIAAALDARGVPFAAGGRWSPQAVANLKRRVRSI